MESKLLICLVLMTCLTSHQVSGGIPCSTSCDCRFKNCCLKSPSILLTSSNPGLGGLCKYKILQSGDLCDPDCSQCNRCPRQYSCQFHSQQNVHRCISIFA